MRIGILLKATRANFLPASVLPFITGAVLAFREGYAISPVKVVLGLLGVVTAHLSGNMVNDYFDHKSGADVRTDRKSPFFGGSGIIQDGQLSQGEVLLVSGGFLVISLICALTIFIITEDVMFLLIMALAGILAVEYTSPPLRLAYKKLGELDIFFLFGIFMVMSSFYLFTGKFTSGAFIASLPVSFMIGAVVICNEVPDMESDTRAGKRNLVSFFGKKNGYMFYTALVVFSYIAILVNIDRGLFSPFTAVVVVFYPLGLKAALMLKKRTDHFDAMVKASAMTITLHALVGTGIVAGIIVR